jgi:hypothetical protein
MVKLALCFQFLLMKFDKYAKLENLPATWPIKQKCYISTSSSISVSFRWQVSEDAYLGKCISARDFVLGVLVGVSMVAYRRLPEGVLSLARTRVGATGVRPARMFPGQDAGSGTTKGAIISFTRSRRRRWLRRRTILLHGSVPALRGNPRLTRGTS